MTVLWNKWTVQAVMAVEGCVVCWTLRQHRASGCFHGAQWCYAVVLVCRYGAAGAIVVAEEVYHGQLQHNALQLYAMSDMVVSVMTSS